MREHSVYPDPMLPPSRFALLLTKIGVVCNSIAWIAVGIVAVIFGAAMTYGFLAGLFS
jgi:hypothetical protein